VDLRVAAASVRAMAYASAVQGLARAVQLASLAAGSALIARRDSPAVLGMYGLAVLLLNLVQTSGDWGLTPIGTQALVAAEPGVSSGALVRLRSQVQLPILVAAAIATAAAWASGSHAVAFGVGFGAAAGVLTNVAGGATAPFQTRMRLDVPAWIDVATRLAGLVAVVGLVVHHQPGWAVAATIPATALLDLAATAWAARRFGFGLWGTAPSGVTRGLLRRATPLAVLTIFGVLYLRANSLVVLGELGTARLGAYSLVFRVVDVLVMAPSLVLTVAFPVLVRLHSTDPAAYRAACQRTNDSLVAVGCAMALATALAARPLIELLGGDRYLGVVHALRILALAGLAGFTNALFAQLMIVEGLQRAVVSLSAIALAANIGLSLVLVHAFGLTGAAVAAAISEVAGAAIVITVVDRRAALGIRWRASGALAVIAGGLFAAGLAIETTGVPPLAITAAATVLYLVGWRFVATRFSLPLRGAARA
jgi:O-antigen/teichoic acid export membrane protein